MNWTNEQLDATEAICNAATEEPWEVGGPYPTLTVIVCVDGGCGYPNPEPPIYEPICVLHQGGINGDWTTPPPEEAVKAAEFIAHARTALPSLVEAYRRLQQESAELRARAEAAEAAVCELPKCFTLVDGKAVQQRLVVPGMRLWLVENSIAHGSTVVWVGIAKRVRLESYREDFFPYKLADSREAAQAAKEKR